MRICAFLRVMGAHRAFYPSLIQLLAPMWQALGHEVTVLTTAMPDGTSAVRREGIAEVHYLAGTRPERTDAAYEAATAATFDRLHRENPFDLAFGRGPAVWGFLSQSAFAGDVPLVMHEGTYPRWLHQLDRKLPRAAPLLERPFALVAARRHRVYRQCLQRAALVICNSPALAEALVRVNWWAPPRTRFIPYGFDIAPFAAQDRPAEVPRRLVNVGRLTWDKGVLDMVDILAGATDPAAVLEMIGPANDRVLAAVRKRAMARGVAARLRLPGAAKNADLPSRLAGATAYLFPSTHPEGLSKSVMEGMAAGLPVIAYDMPGMRVLIDDGVTGFVVPTSDVAGATARLNALLADPALAARMGAAARAKLLRAFSHEAANAQWAQALADVAGRAGG